MLKIGHRGAPAYAPENTLLSFQKAIDLGVDMIEMDIYCCKTGEPVVIHDEKVDRTTNGKGYVEDMTFEEISALDAGSGQRVPSLAQVLEFAASCGRVALNLELKGSNTVKPVNDLINQYISDGKYKHDDFYISSFNHYLLKEFHALNKRIKIGALTSSIHLGLARFAKKLSAYSINTALEFTNRRLVNDAHKRDLKVFVYTVNDLDDYIKMKDMGVDGIFTNYPDRF